MNAECINLILSLTGQLSQIRGRGPSRHLVNGIRIDYYGTSTLIEHISAISVSGDSIHIEPYDKTTLKAIEKAVNNSTQKLSASNDGTRISIHIPVLTQDRIKDLTKEINIIAERHRVVARELRRKEIVKVRDHALSEDEVKQSIAIIDEQTKDLIDKINGLANEKVEALSE